MKTAGGDVINSRTRGVQKGTMLTLCILISRTIRITLGPALGEAVMCRKELEGPRRAPIGEKTLIALILSK